ncbi:MAG: RHS repeat-associated core domain-containing protein, partial [Bacteroidales bacterium]
VNPDEPSFYYTTDHLGSSSYITNDLGQTTQIIAYMPYGEDWVNRNFTQNFRSSYKYNGKEKDPESGYYNYGARYYGGNLPIWLSVDPMSDKYPHLTSYNYCSNNPVVLRDPDGKDGVGVVKNNTITIKATYYVVTSSNRDYKNTPSYSYIYSKNDVTKMEKSINKTLNDANYKVTEGEYAGYDVKFDLKFIPSDHTNYLNLAEKEEYNGIPIGNTFEKSLPEINNNLVSDNPTKTRIAGVAIGKKSIIMNSRLDFKRERTHEIFHTLFFDRDNAKEGIGNYDPGTDMPNQEDINILINNRQLQKVEE